LSRIGLESVYRGAYVESTADERDVSVRRDEPF
jgi:hypothetical protein